MTSGTFHSISIDSIRINREERQRRELKKLPELAESISRIGLINPVTVTRDLVLIAGERRLEACRSLGWTDIPCHYVDEESTTVHRSIELEENIKRENITWDDQCKAVLEYHEIRKSEEPEWSQNDTGAALGMSAPMVSDYIRVARELVANNPRVVNAPRLSTAVGIVDRQIARRDDKAVAALHKVLGTPAKPTDEPVFPDSVLNADFNAWAPGYSGPKFNFLHCDFPYGINADKFVQGAATLHGGYDDSPDAYWSLLRTLADNLDRLLTESCHIMFWFSMHYYADTLQFFARNTDFVIDPFPLIWHKSDNIGIIPDPQRGPRRVYETCLFGSRGDRKIVSSVSNTFSGPSVRDQHMSIKPQAMLQHFFRMFVDTHSIVLDPTCGSGSSLRAAELAGASYVLGLEANPEFAEGAATALNKARAARKPQ